MRFFSLFLGFFLLWSSFLSAKPVTVKFATLAPKGSTWMNLMDKFAADVFEKTNGGVKFKIYPGGVQGDEQNVIRKIRFGQIHAGGFTGVGLGMVSKELRVLDAPFLFETTKEADFIYNKFDSEFRGIFERNGYILLGWAEVGFVHLFTQTAVKNLKDLQGTTMWLWEGDPIAEAIFKKLGILAVSLSITDVLTSLQTGLIKGVYGSPLSVVALQWFSKVKYMFSLPIATAAGAVLISKKKFMQIKPEHQKILLGLGDKYFKELTALSRTDNKKSIAELKKQNIIITNPENKAVEKQFKEAGKLARADLAGKVYSKNLLTRIEAELKKLREKPKNKKITKAKGNKK